MTTKQILHIQGMDCAGCARTIETGIRQLDGVQACTLNFTSEKLHVTGTVKRDAMIERVRDLGFDVAEEESASTTPEQTGNFLQFLWRRRATQMALLGVLLIMPGLIFEELLGRHHPLIDLASVGAMIAAGIPIVRSAWRSLTVNREITINALMSIAAVGAVIIGAYTEAGMVMVLFALGEALEGYTSSRARDALRSLMQVVPKMAMLLRKREESNSNLMGVIPLQVQAATSCGDSCGCSEQTAATPQQVHIDTLEVGDVILVKPGERIPMDGRVLAGASSVNQSPITGESRLMEKEINDDVFASSINGEGVLELEVTHRAADNTISRVIKMVEEAQEQRAPTQRFIDRFAHYYTPAVVVLAILVATIPPLFFGLPFWNPGPDTIGWLYRALALLVVACPCALVISTPVSIISAISNAARSGVLIKGGVHLEQLSRIKTMAFDKTGTLTEGRPSVVSTQTLRCPQPNVITTGAVCHDCSDMLALASAVEYQSEHPLAQAIVQQASSLGVQHKYPIAEGVQALAGRGVTGIVGGQSIVIGSHRLFDSTIPHTEAMCAAAQYQAEQGHTPIMVGVDGRYQGMMAVSDTVRENSRGVVDSLKQVGINDLVMLTGDNESAARKVGASIGMTDVRADLLPEDKVQAVRSLRAEYGPIAMVGDGINDAPALATADVGIAIGGASGGTAQAMETADITLMRDDIQQLPFAVALSHATMRTIQTNIVLSLSIKFVFMVLVLLGVGTMWMAVITDMGTSILVTLYGMRLLHWQKLPHRGSV
ncbi:MAG: Cd2+/Zn2+-exporting ATPase [Chloroflexi bacterium AL-W]|nr:Cd2+/Zn2+-exporting ATPase [Chloroflexi bacterium AL-N1]NOK68859.1 Cd2+/Zn2+-exporting ATPase [Chloroflexi bacterium AL-N10]NOK76843.1 Cd2+/Zn2+-exporting ATPase [Chloroflexi bacterium AL-N5]NOK82770.1 Cd2+/Zn2+-exporting ATPase [Chloroflexi bacterium AL-W]NOK90700.1 Cd2+/Zn2+-exporting ATPase [Chloroflexi bacterium AL-N15]